MKNTYRDLIVWKKAIDLTVLIYTLTKNFPETEKFGLITQMQRSAVSISSNIAEGKLRGHGKEWRHFLLIAYGSSGELETQIEISKRLGYASGEYEKIDSLLEEVMKMLYALIKQSSTSYRLTPIA